MLLITWEKVVEETCAFLATSWMVGIVGKSIAQSISSSIVKSGTRVKRQLEGKPGLPKVTAREQRLHFILKQQALLRRNWRLKILLERSIVLMTKKQAGTAWQGILQKRINGDVSKGILGKETP